MRLFEVLNEKIKPQHNETILSFQYCKLIGQQCQVAEEWMGRLRIKANECVYKEKDKILREQCINGISNDEITNHMRINHT